MLLENLATPADAADANELHVIRMDTGHECSKWGPLLRVHVVSAFDEEAQPLPDHVRAWAWALYLPVPTSRAKRMACARVVLLAFASRARCPRIAVCAPSGRCSPPQPKLCRLSPPRGVVCACDSTALIMRMVSHSLCDALHICLCPIVRASRSLGAFLSNLSQQTTPYAEHGDLPRLCPITTPLGGSHMAACTLGGARPPDVFFLTARCSSRVFACAD